MRVQKHWQRTPTTYSRTTTCARRTMRWVNGIKRWKRVKEPWKYHLITNWPRTTFKWCWITSQNRLIQNCVRLMTFCQFLYADHAYARPKKFTAIESRGNKMIKGIDPYKQPKAAYIRISEVTSWVRVPVKCVNCCELQQLLRVTSQILPL